MKTNFHHIGIVVTDLKKAVLKYCQALEMNPETIKINRQSYITGKGEDEEIDYAFIPLGNNCFIELVTPLTDGPTKRYLEKKGEGLFHLALESTDIKYTIERFEKAGIPQAGMTPTEGIFSVFFHPKSANGVLMQVIKKGILLPDGSPNLEVAMNEN